MMDSLPRRSASLFRGTAVLVIGNALAQAVPFLATPLLTRIFDAHAFAHYALLASAASLLGGVSALRFDLAVSIAKSRDDATALWFVSLYVILAVGLLLATAGACVPGLLLKVGLAPLGDAWWWVPMAGVAMALTQLNSNWLLRGGAVGWMASAKLVQALAFVGSALVLGWEGGVSDGMMYAFGGAAVIGAIVSKMMSYRVGLPTEMPSWLRCREVVRRFRDFPLLGALPSILDAVSLLLPLFAISAHYSVGQTGQFALVRQTVVAPLSLISSGVGQVLLRQVSDCSHQGRDVWPPVRVGGYALASIAIPVALVLALFGAEGFALVFGAKWRDAGHVASALAVPFCLRFLVSGLSSALPALRRLDWVAGWQSAYFIAIVGLITVPGLSFERFILIYAMIETVFYLIYAGLILKCVQVARAEVRS